VDLGDSRSQVVQGTLDGAATADAAHADAVVGEQHALFGRQLAEREPDRSLRGRLAQANGQPEVDRQLEVDVEELRPQLEGTEV
jgi:hypothetical protein